MNLAWAKYIGKAPRYILFVHIGEHNDKHVLLETSKIPNTELETFKNLYVKMKSIGVPDRKMLIKSNMPISYRDAYKEIMKSKLNITRRYPIKFT